MTPIRRFPTLGLAALVLSACSDYGPVSVPEEPAAFHQARAVPTAPPGKVNILTRNLYVGGDTSPLVGAEDPIAAALQVWNEILHTDYPARAARLAGEIARLQPDLVGLQEVIRFTIGPFPPVGFPSDPLLDFLDVLQLHLQALGAQYAVAVRHANTRLAAPVPFGATVMTVGVEQADAILVRAGVQTRDPHGQTYAASPPPELTAGFPFFRGWTQVDARIGGGWVRFANTHLEIQAFAPVQEAQARELIANLGSSPHPVILVGDFNSAANPSAPADRKTASYGLLRDAGFYDVWTRRGKADGGLTCCFASDLSDESPAFDQRLDLVLARNLGGGSGFAGGAFVALIGADPDDRFVGTEGHTLWPSDHAGVAAELLLPPGLMAGRR